MRFVFTTHILPYLHANYNIFQQKILHENTLLFLVKLTISVQMDGTTDKIIKKIAISS